MPFKGRGRSRTDGRTSPQWGSTSDCDTDVPLYEVKRPAQTFMYVLNHNHGSSLLCHEKWHSLACVGVCNKYGMDVPVSTPVKPTPKGSDSKTMPQEEDGLAITQHQARKTPLEWINEKLHGFSHGCQLEVSTEDGWRFLGNVWWMWMHLYWQNGWTGSYAFGEGIDTSTHRCHQLVDWMTTTTTHRTGIHGSKTTGVWNGYTSPPCQVFWWLKSSCLLWCIEYSYSTIEGPKPLT